MVSESREFLPDAWWFATFPGLAIFLVVFAFNLLGDGLRDIVDPRSGARDDLPCDDCLAMTGAPIPRRGRPLGRDPNRRRRRRGARSRVAPDRPGRDRRRGRRVGLRQVDPGAQHFSACCRTRRASPRARSGSPASSWTNPGSPHPDARDPRPTQSASSRRTPNLALQSGIHHRDPDARGRALARQRRPAPPIARG
ncbi:MAG: hypothetical protein WDO24_25115 [Pseudomonadota bacterium]